MERITYRYNLLVKPEDISIGNEVDEKRIIEELKQNGIDEMVEIAKATEKIYQKIILNSKLSPIEEQAYEYYYGNNKPQLQLNPDNGKIEVSDGKHRMMALKLAGVSVYLNVLATAFLQPVRIEKQTDKNGSKECKYAILPEEKDRKYLIVEQVSNETRLLQNKEHGLMILQANRDDKKFLLISKRAITSENKIMDILYNLQSEHHKIYGTRSDFYKGGIVQ